MAPNMSIKVDVAQLFIAKLIGMGGGGGGGSSIESTRHCGH
jgi:hypothetical protein